ncbi:tRNA (adenosine(37)-N6)-threonylcarbamoyltransferase complex ATPase subunit type 1 TsaE [Companilactobacillus alimentarius]|uniref:tRNA threonylcarbamoyladenosine biosynthesis protein TsaE n=1 Tax=Companilactobacillus alimentarius DSM 20249 TaxID=1423720 RepID=A0A2K9HNN0_9LACO|nr:tRNA (adenosine(37)-N6)-threonylcarbamoyltransferase complex ATPase subunit type 1 TsaE [Companilactobacillus alimentarius]AUI70762.1 tRNA (adenosine(37)-N6)-threonylcarbamoyltransferase complex ATPase subunit type 1 TsaE [Companilactobacillus alimentarius DSM 20249]KRK74510.1 ATP GTP hydrolase [Companilactobacillus alimentarius DSM 20249]MDT6952066.1 tRNA (adenosine(37)-N6)-threonylcarbamoyltransferase complex ATPase subunit type 1 TsaE [Companilactobacillus alimentarius]GEO45985.1 tRNA (ad
MLEYQVTTHSYEETEKIGAQMANLLKIGDVVVLNGDLGAGKTALTRGLARGLGIKKNVKSPTFTLIREYQDGRIPLYHMDAYRLESSPDEDLGFDEYFNGNGITVVEWPQFIKDEIPEEHISINISRLSDTDRQIVFKLHGKKYADRKFGELQ